jgi:hypothetical protein
MGACALLPTQSALRQSKVNYGWEMPPLRYWPFPADLGNLTQDDIHRLITDGIPEGLFVEYKRAFDKDQTVRTVAAFANSQGGGTLMIGIEENDRIPIKADGISQTIGLDEQIVQTIRSNVVPVPDFDIQAVPMAKDRVCIIIRVPMGSQQPYVTVPKGQLFIRTQVGTEPIKDQATLDRLFATGEAGRRWASARVTEETADIELHRNQVSVWTMPEVENGLGANVIIFRRSFLDYMSANLAVPIEAILDRPRYSTGPGLVVVTLDDAPMFASAIHVWTTGIVKTTWANTRDPEVGIDLISVGFLVTKALPKHRSILEDKLGHRGDVTITVAGVVNGRSVRVTRSQVPIAEVDKSTLYEGIDREIHRALGRVAYEPEPED